MSRHAPLIRTVLTAAAVAATSLAAALLPGAPASAAYSDPLVATSRASMGLTYHAESGSALAALDAAMTNVGVAALLDDHNHTMTGCNTEEKAAKPIAPAATWAACFDSGDASTTTWNPQGLTSSGDADDDGLWGATKALVSGWHYRLSGSRYNDARVAFIDMNASPPVYRWTYLVDPNSTGSTFSAAKSHMGGMIWYGDKLIVSGVGESNVALRVFSTKHILKTTSLASAVGKVSDGYAAYGYDYVMVQTGYYTFNSGACDLDSDTGVPCFSSISLDRSTSPDSLVTAEYFSDQTKRGRVARYSFGANYLLPSSASPVEAYASRVGNQQGVLSYGGKWWLAHSSATYHGQLWRFTGAGTTGAVRSCTVGGATTNLCWSLHPEALTYFYASSTVYSITEWSTAEPQGPGGRVLFGVPMSAMP